MKFRHFICHSLHSYHDSCSLIRILIRMGSRIKKFIKIVLKRIRKKYYRFIDPQNCNIIYYVVLKIFIEYLFRHILLYYSQIHKTQSSLQKIIQIIHFQTGL